LYKPVRDRRDPIARQALLSRIQGEFREMPGLSLTVDQAARLFGLPSEACTRVLGVLEHSGVLRQAGDGQYRLRGVA
jgi:DNA-binding IclR family transcriptional regulator